MKTIKFILLIILITGCKTAQIEKTTTPIIEKFFLSVKEGAYKEGLNDLIQYNSNFNKADSSINNLTTTFNYINVNSGKFLAAKIIKINIIQNDIIVYEYLVEYELRFYRFLIIFYDNGTESKIVDISIDNAIMEKLVEFNFK